MKIDYEARCNELAARCQVLETENEALREAAHAALVLLGNTPLEYQAGPQVLSVVQALEEALDTEQDEDEDE